MTAPEYLSLCGECLGMPRSRVRERSEELLALVGLAEEKHRIRGFSRGMKQRLGIAQALLASPKLLICDEPTSALDPVGRKEILDILRSVRSQTTVLFSTHVLSDVERICTDVAFLNDGKIAMQGSVAQLRALHGTSDIQIELPHPDQADRLLSLLPTATHIDAVTLALRGDDTQMSHLLQVIAQHNLPVVRIERIEPSLESVFLEVVS
jgi:ABC-2 type transport system ATP-binding protein